MEHGLPTRNDDFLNFVKILSQILKSPYSFLDTYELIKRTGDSERRIIFVEQSQSPLISSSI